MEMANWERQFDGDLEDTARAARWASREGRAELAHAIGARGAGVSGRAQLVVLGRAFGVFRSGPVEDLRERQVAGSS